MNRIPANKPLTILNFQFDQPAVILAPMAGLTDLPFRQLCRDWGADWTVAEMISSDTSLWASPKSVHRLRYEDEAVVQILGNEPEMMALAAQRLVQLGAGSIDINMGCPAKKVCKKAAGSALMRDEGLVRAILQAVVQAVSVPVSLKMRTGWDRQHRNAPRIAAIAQDCGIALLTVHGRSRACGFSGQAEYETIRITKQSVDIPVIANGDIDSPQKAAQVLEYTGCDGVMIGRAAIGRPWVFQQIKAYLYQGQMLPEPHPAQKKQIMQAHLQALHQFYGEAKGVRIARKHMLAYLKDQPRELKQRFNQLQDAAAQLVFIKNDNNLHSNLD